MIPPWFQACKYWKKSVIWRHHFQASVFCKIISLFHRSTWDDSYVKDTVFISQHLVQPSIIKSGLWLIQEKLKGMFIWGKPLEPALLKVLIYFTELVALIFVEKYRWNRDRTIAPRKTASRKITPNKSPLDSGDCWG